MPTDVNQWVEAVAKLTALTQDGSLQWEARSPFGERSVVGLSYYTEYKHQRLRLERRMVVDEDAASFRRGSRVERIFLEFIDNDDNSLWTFPEVDALEDLYSAVRYQTAGAKAFLDDLLSTG